MKTACGSAYFFLSALLIFLFLSCGDSNDYNSGGSNIFSSYRDIPGVTSEEIAAIEELKKTRDSFVVGMLPTTEAFLNANGEISGYSALLCEWLSYLFGIKFNAAHFSWFGLLDGLAGGEVDFAGDLTATEERRKTYYMTGAIAQRSLKLFRAADSAPLSEISRTRLPRYILQEKTTVAEDVEFFAGGTFEPVFILEYDEAYELLKTGKADALITESVQEAFWDIYSDIEVSDFFPLIYSPVSLSAQNPQLAVIISVIQKALDSEASRYFNVLYDRGYQEYLKHKFSAHLSSDEIRYIKSNPVISFAAEYDNYPVSFYSSRFNEWQGISIDVLKQIEMLTGLSIQIKHNNNVEFYELLNMLENGEADILSELIRTEDRENRFIWPHNSFMTERSVLISKLEHYNININRIYTEKVGLSKGTAHTEFFLKLIPNHPNIVMFESQSSALEALMNDEVDMVMSSNSMLLYLTNYQELPGFKANVIFDNYFDSTFGINKDRFLLCSIVDKALGLIDTDVISEQWRSRTYDYRLKVEQARTPLMIGSITLSLLVLILLAILFRRSLRAGKDLEMLVEKRTYELALQTSTLTTLFDSIPDLIFTKNLNSEFLHCNKAFLEHFNKNIDEVIGKNDKNNMGLTEDEIDAFIETDRKVISDDRTVSIEERIPRYDGFCPIYETIKTPLKLNGEPIGIMGISRNITKRKEMEAAALAASKSKSAFLANMSHEIRTPMNTILGVTELLIQNEKLPSDISEGLDKIFTSCTLLLGIINDILDFSKIEAGKLDIIPAQYRIAGMISDSLRLNMLRADSKPIAFELNIDENIPAKLIGDELRIKQILNNLLSNAFKYTDSGKIILTAGAERLSDDQITLFLSVSDTGYGMTREQIEKMFDEYSRFNRRKNNIIEGAGLGLPITQQLLNLMNGKMSVESQPGKGSLFSISLPQGIVDGDIIGKAEVDNIIQFRANMLNHKKREQLTRDPMPYGKVLIVDDVETNLYVAEGLMKLYRLNIDTVMSGMEAIEKITKNNIYDIIFMDHMMPEMDGIEAVKIIREFGYKSVIVALTANAVAGQADVFLQNGFDGFLSKPIDVRILDSILNKYIRDKQPPEVVEEARRQKANAAAAAAAEADENDEIHIDSVIIESFIRDAEKAVEWLEKRIDAEGFSEDEALRKYTIFIHGLKSSLWNIGEKELSEFAFNLEIRGRERDLDFITEETPDFLIHLHALVAKLKHERGGETKKETPPESKDEQSVLHYKNQIPGVDLENGLMRYDGDEEIYIKVLRLYVNNARSMLKKIAEVSADRLADYKIGVHSIKGISFEICADQIGSDAKVLEDAAKNGDIGYLNGHNPAFMESVWKLIHGIEETLSKIENKS